MDKMTLYDICDTGGAYFRAADDEFSREYLRRRIKQDGTLETVALKPYEILLQTFEKIQLSFQSRIVEQELQIGMFRVPIPNYEKQAFREGFVNALVHRDCFRVGAVQVQLHKTALSISSPGGFLEGISHDNILTVSPTPRNVLLTEAAKRIGLAEPTGRGIDKIYTVILRSGYRPRLFCLRQQRRQGRELFQ